MSVLTVCYAVSYDETNNIISGLNDNAVVSVNGEKAYVAQGGIVNAELKFGDTLKIMNLQSLATLKPLSKADVQKVCKMVFNADEEIETWLFLEKEELDFNEKQMPDIPEKAGYTADWDTTAEIVDSVKEIRAIYTPIEYTATFMAGEVEVAKVTFTVEDETIDEPEVPFKKNYDGVWEDYEIVADDIIINAVYALTREYIDTENEEELFHFTNLSVDFKKHTFTGLQRKITNAIISVADGVVEDINNGILITEAHIRSKYNSYLESAKADYKALGDTLGKNAQTKYQGDAGRLIKDDTTFDYFEAFAKKYIH